MATRLRAERSGVGIPIGARNSSPKLPGRLREPSSFLFKAFGIISQLCNGRGVKTTHIHLSPGLRMSGAIPLPPYISPLNVLSGTKVKNEWSYTSTPPICLH